MWQRSAGRGFSSQPKVRRTLYKTLPRSSLPCVFPSEATVGQLLYDWEWRCKDCFARVGQNDVIPGAPSLKSKAFEHASDALARIERKVFDTHLGADQFNFWRLDANGTLILPARVGFRRVVLLH